VRLEREARLLVALNHPHVAAIYGRHFLMNTLIDKRTMLPSRSS
jgi:hypothetical protein